MPAPPPGLRVYSLGGDRYLYDDTAVDYTTLMPETSSSSFATFTPTSSDDSDSEYTLFGYNEKNFWLELRGFDTNVVVSANFFSTNTTTNVSVLLRLHGTISNELYQLESTTSLATPGMFWTRGQIITGSTNFHHYTDFSPVGIYNSGPINPFFIPAQFFRAHHADVVLQVVQTASPAVRPLPPSGLATNGTFTVQVETTTAASPYTNFQFTYTMSGGAVNGVDYTNISGTNTITASGSSYSPTSIDIWPIVDNSNKLNVEAIMTLNLGTGYLVSTDAPSAVVEVDQNFGTFIPFQFVTNAPSAIGMAWHPLSNSLILSVNYNTGGGQPGFARLDTNAVLHAWSGVQNTGFPNEVNLTIVPTNAGGFNAGDMYFSSGGFAGIAFLSSDATVSNLFWTNGVGVNPNDNSFEAGFYLDQTGIFSNDLIMATSGGGIYSIDSQTNVTPLAYFPFYGFECAVTLPNDTNTYGPWAGKILTGAESTPTIPYIMTVDTNLNFFQYPLSIAAEDVHIIPTNQDFYINDQINGQILKLPRHWFTNYVGDVLFSQEGAGVPPELFILHWDATSGTFIKHIVPAASSTFLSTPLLEEGAFAPDSIPATPIHQ